MAEYVILLGGSMGGQWIERLRQMLDDPMVLWGGAATGLVVLVLLLKPNR